MRSRLPVDAGFIQFEDLVGPPELTVLPAELLQLLPLLGGEPVAEALVHLGPADPVAQGLSV